MFSDANEVLWFGGAIIRYCDLKSYSLVENIETETRSKANRSKVISAAVMGEVVFNDSLLGIALANPELRTTTYQWKNGFQLCVRLKNGSGYSIPVLNAGFFRNKASKRWHQAARLILATGRQRLKNPLRQKKQKKIRMLWTIDRGCRIAVFGMEIFASGI